MRSSSPHEQASMKVVLHEGASDLLNKKVALQGVKAVCLRAAVELIASSFFFPS